MNNMTPGVFIKHHKSIDKVFQKDFATLFITFGDDNFSKPLIILNSFAQTIEYEFLRTNSFLLNSIEAFFSNKGMKLYLLNFPINDENYFDIFKFENFLNRNCDDLMDLEVIIGLDLYDSKIYKEILSQKSIVSIQRSINQYAKKTNRLSITDICDDFDYSYLDVLSETIIYYPWIKDKTSLLLPPSVYASALFSKFANEEKTFSSIANKELLSTIDVQKNLNSIEKSKLIENRINPVVLIPYQGVRIWGTKTFDSKMDTVVESRIIKYIKRNLYKMAKVYIFEPNDLNLRNKLEMKVNKFLYELWEKGTLVGTTKDQAYLISTDISDINEREDILSINIAVALVKPIEFIYIEMNKVAQDGTQSTLSIN